MAAGHDPLYHPRNQVGSEPEEQLGAEITQSTLQIDVTAVGAALANTNTGSQQPEWSDLWRVTLAVTGLADLTGRSRAVPAGRAAGAVVTVETESHHAPVCMSII